MDKERKALGARIKTIRTAKGLTQENLGEMAALNYKYIGELERGRVNVSLDSLGKIAGALGVPIGELFSPVSTQVIKISVREPNPLSKLTPDNLSTIRKALKLLSRTFTA